MHNCATHSTAFSQCCLAINVLGRQGADTLSLSILLSVVILSEVIECCQSAKCQLATLKGLQGKPLNFCCHCHCQASKLGGYFRHQNWNEPVRSPLSCGGRQGVLSLRGGSLIASWYGIGKEGGWRIPFCWQALLPRHILLLCSARLSQLDLD